MGESGLTGPLPSGTVTFLLTDVEGSTARWDRDPDRMAGVMERQEEVLHLAIERHGGARPVEQGEGDSVIAVFTRASQAVAAALDAQLALNAVDWPAGFEVRVRMALHSGDARMRGERNYAGPVIIRCARLRALAAGGQVLMSATTYGLVADELPEGVSLAEVGSPRLKGLDRVEPVYQVCHEGLDAPLATLASEGDASVDTPAPGPGPARERSVLLERESALQQAERILARARGGEGGVLVIEGPAGIGKTALLDEVAASAAAEGFEVLRARGSELDRDFPFGVARQLLERRIALAEPLERRSLLAGVAQDALAPLGLTADAVGGDALRRSLHGLYWLVANLAGRTPVLLCADDAHWADRESLRWLVYAARRLAGVRLVVTLGTRPSEPGAEQDLLDALSLDDAACLIRLAPLSTASVGTLIASHLPGAAATEFEAACHACTGGNPLLVSELLRQLASDGATPTADTARELSTFSVDSVARSVRRRLRQLGGEPTAIAQALTVFGDRAAGAELGAMTELDAGSVRRAVRALIDAGIVCDDGGLRFVHPLIGASVGQDLAAIERAQWHGRAAAVLGTRGADPERIALHLLQVEPAADAEVVDALVRAADQAAARGLASTAARFLRRAFGEPPPPDRRLAVLTALGETEALAGLDGYEQHLSAAIEELSDPSEIARLGLVLGRAVTWRGDYQRGYEVVEATMDRVGSDHPAARAVEAELLGMSIEHHPMRWRSRDRVAQYAERLRCGEPVDVRIQGTIALSLARDHPPAALALGAAEAWLGAQGERLGEADSATTLGTCVGMLMTLGQLSRADEILDRMRAHGARRGAAYNTGFTSVCRSAVAFQRGEIVRAAADAKVAWEITTGDDGLAPAGPIFLLWSAGTLTNALVARGELAEAEACLDRLPLPLPERTEGLLPARAELHLARGRVAEAIADYRAVGTLLGEEFAKLTQNWRLRLAVILAGVGERDEARELAAAELALARRFEVPWAIGAALAASGVVEGGRAGVALLQEGVSMLEPTEARYDHAIALVELGALLRRTGSTAAAREPLRVGLDLAARGGATVLADRAHEELVTAGARPRRERRMLTGPEALTASEFRVAALAAEGLTNREIAQRLYVTESAVHFHLRNTFRKLGVTGRAQLGSALGLAEPAKPYPPSGSEKTAVPA